MTGFVVWFTGLSGSGKSTLAAMLAGELQARGVHVEVLDGDEVRTHLSKGLTFSREDRDTNIRRIGFVAKLIARSGACAMTAAISPYRAIRDEQRASIPRFVEVYCRASIPALAERDVKGLYKKALAGEIKNFTGIDDPYEEPSDPEVLAHTDRDTKEESLAQILAKLEELGYIPASGEAAPAALPGAARLVPPHGGELVTRRARGAARSDLEAMAEGLPQIELDEGQLADLESIASGAFSPLRGFMNAKDYLKVVRSMHLETGLPWAVPVTLRVSEEVAARVTIGGHAALCAGGRPVALIEIDDRFTSNKELEALALFGTTDASDPRVAALLASGPVCLGGEVQVFADEATAGAAHTPAETRRLLAERGAARVVAWRTPGPMLRADEHVTKAALEASDALLIQVLADAPSALPADVRLAACEALVAGSYAAERVVVSLAHGSPRASAGREAVHAALVLKNHGASHVAHAGDAAAIEAAFKAFSPGQLGVVPLFFEPAFHAAALGTTATSKTAPAGTPQVTATIDDVIATIARGEDPPAEIARPEVVSVLRAAILRHAREA